MKIRFTFLMTALLAVLLLTGCALTPVSVPGDEQSTPGQRTADTPERLRLIDKQITRARTAPLALAPQETTTDYRLIEHPLGEARVPLQPQRIVTLEPSLTDVVAALGFGDQIVGTVEWQGEFHAHITPFLGPDVVSVGTEAEPNLEAIALAEPDLILTWDWYSDVVPQLEQIAPTVMVPYAEYQERIGETYSDEQYITWLVREVAAVLGAEDRVEPVMQTYRDAVTDGRARLAEALGDQTVALLDVRVERILLSGYGSDGISALLYGDLRINPDPLSEQFYVWENLSLERIPDLTADYILTFAASEEAEERLAELLDNPLWQTVPAVRNNRVFTVPSGLYYRGDDGPLGAVQVIDDVVAKLTDAPNAASVSGASGE